jgi:hypothetical protein
MRLPTQRDSSPTQRDSSKTDTIKRERQTMNVDQPYEQEETDLAASEAALIGGGLDEENAKLDPAQRPVSEAGGGEAEGFEQSEATLIEHASHGDQQAAHEILHDQNRAEEENLRREDAEADHERSSELGDER